MQTNERYTRRLATLFLGLFLSLLAMVSLHDFSHRADAVQDVVSTEGYTSYVTKTDCSICHFVHTPFLALAIGTLLAAVALGVRLLGVRLVRLAHSLGRVARGYRWLYPRRGPLCHSLFPTLHPYHPFPSYVLSITGKMARRPPISGDALRPCPGCMPCACPEP